MIPLIGSVVGISSAERWGHYCDVPDLCAIDCKSRTEA